MQTETKLLSWTDVTPEAIVSLFQETFSQAADDAEGRIVSELVRALMDTTPTVDLYGFVGLQSGTPVAAVFFSRLRFEALDACFLLSPLAVLPSRQRQGLGQRLLRHAIAKLRANHAAALFTYGDPAYYSKVGFAPVSIDEACPPYPLSQPEGWLFQALSARVSLPLRGKARCVSAMQDPTIW